jgi:hypothetical protein
MNRRLFIVAVGFTSALCNVIRAQDDITGAWEGTLPKANLPLVFRFRTDGSGTVDSPKQNFRSAARIKLSGSEVTISVPAVGGTFSGTLENGKMTGAWSQGSGYSDDLILEKQ